MAPPGIHTRQADTDYDICVAQAGMLAPLRQSAADSALLLRRVPI